MSDATVTSALQDSDGSYSSRRVAAFVALAVYAVVGIYCIVFLRFTEAFVTGWMQGLMVIIIGGLALATADRFAPK